MVINFSSPQTHRIHLTTYSSPGTRFLGVTVDFAVVEGDRSKPGKMLLLMSQPHFPFPAKPTKKTHFALIQLNV